MKRFTVDYLNSLTTDLNQLYEAQRLVNGGSVSIMSVTGGCHSYIYLSSGTTEQVFVSVSPDGDRLMIAPSRCTCTCGRCSSERGFVCSHVLAAALVYQDAYIAARENGTGGSAAGIAASADCAEPPPSQRSGSRGAETAAATDECVLRLVSERSLPSQLRALGRNIALETTALLHSRDLYLSFRVGSKRMYVVKNLEEFVLRFKHNDHFEYGKQFGFTHHTGSFREQDQDMVGFLCTWFYYRHSAGTGENSENSAYRYGAGADPRYFRLSGMCLDAFLDAYSADTMLTDAYSVPSSIGIVRGDPPLMLSLSRAGARCELDIKNNVTAIYTGEKRSVVRFDGKLFFCSEEFTRTVLPIVRDIADKKRPVRIRRDDMSSFVTYVLPPLEKAANVELLTDIEPFVPPELDARVNISRYSDTEISVRLIFGYGANSYSGFGAEQPHHGDFAKEQLIRELVRGVFSPCRESDGALIKTFDDDALFAFERSGRARLEEYCRIYCDEEFRLRVRRPGGVSIGVRINAGLLDMDISISDEDRAELAGILASLRARKKYHRLKSGEFLSLESSALAQLSDIAEGLDLTASQLASGHVELPVYRALYLDNAVKSAGGITYSRDNDFRRLARTLRGAVDADYDLPSSVSATLRNYQRAGYRWMMTLSDEGFGCVLADEMGLGKTLEVLTVLMKLKESGCTLPSLVVCPASLVLNWQSEAARFTPSLRAVCVMGSQTARGGIIREALCASPASDLPTDTGGCPVSLGADIIITSYDSLRRDVALYAETTFECIIADEAQYMKNFRTQNARSIKRLSGKRRFALTGTPIENNLSELWSIFDFIMPGYFFGYTRFRQRYEIPVVRDGDDDAARNLRLMSTPFILRRLKRDVLGELPPKTETVIPVEMEDAQRKLYLASALEAQRSLAGMSGANQRFQILALLTRLRQICCDPSLLYEDYSGGSAKLDMCMELVRQCIDSSRKLLLFSQFTSMLDIIERRLDDEGIRFYRLDGSTPAVIRKFQIDQFNRDDVPVFLISLKAGGTGINLTGASCVIHYDPWWNSSAQDQADGRSHRIGQEHAVQVYKLVIKDSIEERILALQKAKSAIIDKVIEADQASISSVTTEDLLELLRG